MPKSRRHKSPKDIAILLTAIGGILRTLYDFIHLFVK